jgi:hypothetical protein
MATMANMASSENFYDIMISYQWDSQEKCLMIKHGLERWGYRVWFDVDQMYSGMNDRMAEAIENSKCILICMTRKYKDSVNCKKASTRLIVTFHKMLADLFFLRKLNILRKKRN